MFFQNDPTDVKRRYSNNEVLARSGVISGKANGCYKLGVDQTTGDLYYRDVNNIWQPVPGGGGGGGDERFGVSGEDDTASQERNFDLDGHELVIQGGNIGFGGNPTTFFNVQDGSGGDLISIDKVTFQSLFGATDGSSFSAFVLNSDLTGNNVQFYISSTDNTNLVQITGDALLQTINLGADNGISINSSYTLPLADGTAGQVMTTDGAGIVTWENGGGGGTGGRFGFPGEDDTATENRIFELNDNDFTIVNNGDSKLQIVTDLNSEASSLRADNIATDGGNAGILNLETTDTQAQVDFRASFDGGFNIASITGFADNSTSGFTYNGVQHQFNGEMIFSDYDGSGAHIGSPVKLLGVTNAGNVIEVATDGVVATAGNGLHIDSGSGDVYLGGDLIEATNIVVPDNTDTDSSIFLSGYQFSTDNLNGMFTSVNFGDGRAISGTATNSEAAIFIRDNADNIDNVLAVQTLYRFGDRNVDPESGLGGSLDYYIESAIVNRPSRLSNQLVSKWLDPSAAGLLSEFSITGTADINTVQTLFQLRGDGQGTLPIYGAGTFTGTPTYTLQVDSSGNIIEGSLSGSGLVLQVNSTPNADQSLLNLSAGSGINVTDSGTGTVTISATGGSGRFGVTSEDNVAGEDRLFTYTDHAFQIVNATNTLLADDGNSHATFGAADGSSIARLFLSGNSGEGTEGFQLVAAGAFSGTVDISGNCTSSAINYTAALHTFVGDVGNISFIGSTKIDSGGINEYANNAAAVADLKPAGTVYYTNVAGDAILKIVL